MSRWRARSNPRKSFCTCAGQPLNIAGLTIGTLIQAGILINLCAGLYRAQSQEINYQCNLTVINFLLFVMQRVISYSIPPSFCILSCDWPDLRKPFDSEGCKYSARTIRPQSLAITVHDAKKKKNQHKGKTGLGLL